MMALKRGEWLKLYFILFIYLIIEHPQGTDYNRHRFKLIHINPQSITIILYIRFYIHFNIHDFNLDIRSKLKTKFQISL